MALTVYLFLIVSAVGLSLSVISHICALRGVSGPIGDQTWLLQIGIFIVWLPAILAANWLSGNVPRKDLWKAVLRGSLGWMKYGFHKR